MFANDDLFWLNMTNLFLGIATVYCMVAVGYSALKEVFSRWKLRDRREPELDDHTFVADGLGITLADGGERIDASDVLVVTEDSIETAGKADEITSTQAKREENRK